MFHIRINRFFLASLVISTLALPLRASADPFADILRQGWTASDLADVPALLKEKVEPTLRRPTVVRHFTQVETGARNVAERWLLEHPAIATDVGREIKVLPFTLQESWPGTYQIEGGPVLEGTVTWLQQSDSRALLYASMLVQSPWGSDVRTLVVICLRWWPDARGERTVHDIFIYGRMPSRAARIMSSVTRPLTGPVITRKLRRIIYGATTIADSISNDPEGWAERMLPTSDRPGGDRVAWEQLIAMQAPQ